MPDERSADSENELGTSSELHICGLWMRLLALIFDTSFLHFVANVLGLIFFDTFAQMGGWGHLIGIAIVLVYFGSLNSRFGKGQTLGKRVFRISVVGHNGRLIPLWRSLLRASILWTPWFSSQVWMPHFVGLIEPVGDLIVPSSMAHSVFS